MDQQTVRPTTIAIGALGGQGGGVLANWIVDLAEANGYIAQSTSVPGVAQRTGATIYYIEIFPRQAAEQAGRAPILALMPTPGDVDIMIASELVEAGRAIQRGLVTPGRTTLIASSHRDYAISEKSNLGDGRAEGAVILETAAAQAKRFIHMDMAALALDTSSVISSVLFGALAGAECLPFPREAFKEVIMRGGVAVEANVAGFAAGYAGAQGKPRALAAPVPAAAAAPESATSKQADAIRARVLTTFPDELRALVGEGARRCADYQDFRHAEEYVALAAAMLARDSDDDFYALTREYARYLALWMTYEDVPRVADLKIRAERFAGIRTDVRAEPGEIVSVSEYMHPRFEEVCDMLPAWLGGFLLRRKSIRNLTRPLFRRGRRVRTTSLGGFLMLYMLAGLRRWRPGTLRFRTEMAAISGWTARIEKFQKTDYDLAVEVARCQRLIKGYGDTNARGRGNFNAIMAAADSMQGQENAARTVSLLIDAALVDDKGAALEAALQKAVN
ncbi:MAG: indolepyruvate oxidoreductase subunit beta family protein [Proteobacteria bacterium]|nr:indolepyruvate oxidoreductase subunit beta family protein [Pseudomonadota bacterium]